MSILTINDVAETVRIRSKGKAKLLSTEYVNNEEKLEIQCGCGAIYNRSYASIRRSKLLCDECNRRAKGRGRKLPFEEVKKAIAATGCEYVSGEFVNAYSKLLLRCSCGNLFEKTWRKFKEGQDHCPACGMKNRVYPKSHKPKEKPKEKPKAMPKKDKPKKAKSVTQNKKTKKIKKNPYRHSEIGEIIRERLEPWRTKIKKEYGRRCAVTGVSGKNNIVVHHLLSLNTIFDKVAKEHGIDCHMSDVINFEERPECSELINYILDAHDISMGILISREVHKQFHKEYGYGNNTPEQFNQFLRDHYGTSLEELSQKEVNI